MRSRGFGARSGRAVFSVFAGMVFLGLLARPARPAPLDATLFGKTIRAIELVSDLPLDRSHYDPYLEIKPGDRLTRTGVKQAIQFLYECGRFSQVAVEAFPEGDTVRLRFNLRHNYYFNKFSIEGEGDLKARSSREWASLPVGQRFTQEKLEESQQAILRFMKERGFYGAQISARTLPEEDSQQIDTVFKVQPGLLATIRSIEIKGVPAPKDRQLLRKFGFHQGKKFDRSRLGARIENLRKYFVNKGYLAAVVKCSESFEPKGNTVALALDVTNFGKMRVVIEGFKIDKDQLRRLLPVLTGEGIHQDILEEGVQNLKEYLENKGYSEAEVRVHETAEDSGGRVFHYVIVPSRKFTVSYIRFKGNHALTDQEMLGSVQIQPASLLQNTAYSVNQLDDDVDSLKSLYESRGYLQAEIVPLLDPIKNGKRLGITYFCEEGPRSRIASLAFDGNEVLSAKELLAKIKLAPGKAYSPSLVEQDRQTLLAAYNDRGYLQAQVTVQVGSPDDAHSYPVKFQIHEGTQSIVDRIFILGNERTRSSIIGKRIKLKEDEPLSLSKLLQTQQGLYGLGVFDQVRVSQQNAESTAPYQDVAIRLQEAQRFTVHYGFGYQERDKLRATLDLTDLNIFGAARQADIRFLASSVEQEALFNIQQPHFRALPVDSYLTFSALERSDISFDSKRFGLSYQFSHPFASHTWGLLRYNFKNVRVFNSQVPISDLGREDVPVDLSTFSAVLINDSRDDYLDPSRGFFSSTDFDVTTKLLGDNDYVSFFSQNSYYRSLSQSLLLAASVRLGMAHPYGGDLDLPISERFFAGGASSLRGFDTDYAGPLDPQSGKPLGGNALCVGSLEVRVPFYKFIRLAGFYDTGNVFSTISDISLSGFSHTLGLGLRIKTPFGPLRADYGYNLNLSPDLQQQGLKRGHLFFTVGPPF
jgi:outer membrane protein assembly complex protein YaeT